MRGNICRNGVAFAVMCWLGVQQVTDLVFRGVVPKILLLNPVNRWYFMQHGKVNSSLVVLGMLRYFMKGGKRTSLSVGFFNPFFARQVELRACLLGFANGISITCTRFNQNH